ncbi:4817_t:CDS:2, partial [Entrophospora sp. SA101]
LDNMPRIHTLSDIGEGKKLGDIPSNRYPPSRTELENQLACANRDREIAIECGNRLANKCSVLDKDNKRIQRDLKQSNKDKEKLSKHTYQLINEVKRLSSELDTLTSQINQLQISNTKYGAKDIIRLKKIKSLQSMNKILNSKLASAQKDAFSIQENLSKTESENLSLKSKIAEVERELASTVSDLECLKSEDISESIVGGTEEKNILSPNNISVGSNISKYFIRRKNVDEAQKIDTENSCETVATSNTKISDSRSEDGKASKTSVSETSKDISPTHEIKNMTPYLAQQENSTISLNGTCPQISMGDVEAMRPGSSYEDISKIIKRYTNDVKDASMVINSYLRKGEFVVFDLDKPEDDPLAIRLRFDTPLDLRKEIQL